MQALLAIHSPFFQKLFFSGKREKTLEIGKDVHLDDFRQVAGSDIITTKNIITDQHDSLVLTTWTTLVGRTGGEVDANIANAVKGVMMHVAS